VVPETVFIKRFSSYGADALGVTVDLLKRKEKVGESCRATIHGTET